MDKNLVKKTDRSIFDKILKMSIKKSEKTRQFIIEQAASLFNQKGFNGTSMADIMNATNMSKGGIYGNFKRDGLDKNGVKEEIAIAAFNHAVEKVYMEIGKRTKVIDNAIDKLKAVVYFYKERVLNPPVEGGCPIQNTAIEADNAHPVLKEKVFQAINEWHRRVIRTVDKGIETGEIRPDVDAAEFATLYIGTIEGGIMLARVQESTEPFEVMSRQLLKMIEELKVPKRPNSFLFTCLLLNGRGTITRLLNQIIMVDTKFIEVLPHFQLETLPEPKTKYPAPVKFVRFAFDTLGRIFPRQAGKIAFHLFTRPRIKAVHKHSDSLLESARLFEILYGKIILKGYEWGSGSKTVLLVHGWESRGTALRSFVPGLVAAGYRVVAFDGPAHGDSGGTHTTFLDFAKAIRAVINQLGSVDSIITHSFGGATSVFALTHIDSSIEIEKLVLIGVPSNTEKIVEEAMDFMNVPPSAFNHFRKILDQRFNNLSFEMANIESTLGKVNAQSVLVVHDKFDKSVPFESAERIMERWDFVNLIVTQGMGHSKVLKNPKVVDMVVDFVAE